MSSYLTEKVLQSSSKSPEGDQTAFPLCLTAFEQFKNSFKMTKHLIRRDDYFYSPHMSSVYVNYEPPKNSDN